MQSAKSDSIKISQVQTLLTPYKALNKVPFFIKMKRYFSGLSMETYVVWVVTKSTSVTHFSSHILCFDGTRGLQV